MIKYIIFIIPITFFNITLTHMLSLQAATHAHTRPYITHVQKQNLGRRLQINVFIGSLGKAMIVKLGLFVHY